MEEFICNYDPQDLEPIQDLLEGILQELVKVRVNTEWILGLSIATFCLMIAFIFAAFLANMSR
jgi:hypothetical protein